ncbi:MAG TPA: hypothetical protein VNS09_23110 [Solirubrobacter sp.]|nr:hypothetical protein [Solirubrobacter sp.]
METSESNIGYPEEQPSEVDDTPGKDTPQRDPARRGRRNDNVDNDDGKATGHPDTDR